MSTPYDAMAIKHFNIHFRLLFDYSQTLKAQVHLISEFKLQVYRVHRYLTVKLP